MHVVRPSAALHPAILIRVPPGVVSIGAVRHAESVPNLVEEDASVFKGARGDAAAPEPAAGVREPALIVDRNESAKIVRGESLEEG